MAKSTSIRSVLSACKSHLRLHKEDYEAHLTMMKEQVDESAQKMQNLEKIVSELKKPCFRIGYELVVGLGLALLLLALGLLKFNH